MTVSVYDIGDVVTLGATFTVNSRVADPTTVVCKVKAPGGTLMTKTYGTDIEIVKESTGVYHLDLEIAAHGRYIYRWEGTGSAQGAEEAVFRVRRSAFSS